uniref:Uncharacterized protein n=1 Tax=Populus trichocarpa TaxID=3694 RepID=A9PFB7_POPTR|nr:unknown [Populus trichocarpa]
MQKLDGMINFCTQNYSDSRQLIVGCNFFTICLLFFLFYSKHCLLSLKLWIMAYYPKTQ